MHTIFYENKFKSVSYKPKLSWQLINEIMRSKSNNKDRIETIINYVKVFDVVMDPKTVSNIFNDFFINVGKKLAENFRYVVINENLGGMVRYCTWRPLHSFSVYKIRATN